MLEARRVGQESARDWVAHGAARRARQACVRIGLEGDKKKAFPLFFFYFFYEVPEVMLVSCKM